jgi:hypothetical protein
MAVKFVVGLFASKGIAEDACNRLKTEGVPAANISLLLMHETAPVPAAVATEPAPLPVDPLVVRDVRNHFGDFIRNGETAVFVRAHSEAEVDLAVATIRQYAPIRIRVVAAGGEGARLGRERSA